ncbi:slr1929 [Synechocystis sp. PCC 6803]|jgi:type II secretory pathway pseudopilin PulG|uniref:Slr1929 protein n=2 Tax=Synechocystis TaxID=1142 RepID=P74481_SYNY3|nr:MULTISPECIES: type II secretion system protein [unclassified Synechocystis]AVP90056.1 type II secretion system protein [Synechocystis sp. IPPAS B-1465]MBD2640603.1 type II secretion system protein [Synechocystis sp. FACHB-908]MBD2662758.1 type II secretion system protein [Synechocystis sp. FACHB-929]BAL29757.1 hypothetical protein SYNGTI_2010 [Synechocystis sp. PCC 6803 substr. GT-I]AGF52270.1 hypothetical protein MYO_120290 [Synechocystis sp. PCC 6803]
MVMKLPNPTFLLKLVFNPHPSTSSQGWTLIEIGVVTVIVGILAAMAFPSLAGIQARNQVRSRMIEVRAAVQEAQRNAIKRGATCTVTIDVAARSVRLPTSPPTPMAGCLNNPVSIPTSEQISFLEPSSGTVDISFSYKGNTVNSQTIVLGSSRTSYEPCLVISSGLGIVRSGSRVGGNCVTGL